MGHSFLSYATEKNSDLVIQGPQKVVCIGSDFQLSANGDPTWEYSWEPVDAFSNSKGQTVTAKIFETTTFRVIRRNPKGVERDTSYFSVGVKEKKVDIQGANYVCKGDSSYIFIDSKYESPLWEDGQQSRGIWVTEPGIYSVTAVDGCYRIEGQLFVASKTKPVSSIIYSGPRDLCEGESVQLSSFSKDQPKWSNGMERSSITISEGGTYILSNQNECGWTSDQINLRFHSVNAQFITNAYEGAAPLRMNLINQSENATDFTWRLNGEVISNLPDPSFDIQEPGTYTLSLTAKDQFGCRDEKVIQHIEVSPAAEYYANNELVIFPNSFSPNGDGLNDEFEVISKGVKDLKLVVFDRWGREIYFNNSGIAVSWDGRNSNGELLPAGMYGLRYSYTTPSGLRVAKISSVHVIR